MKVKVSVKVKVPAKPESAAPFVPPRPTPRTANRQPLTARAAISIAVLRRRSSLKVELTLPWCSSANSRAMQKTARQAQTDDERRVAMETFVADLRTPAKKLSG
ncbi:MAG: hypothetical protein ABW318_14245 [Vicinamibacterales bacterium]